MLQSQKYWTPSWRFEMGGAEEIEMSVARFLASVPARSSNRGSSTEAQLVLESADLWSSVSLAVAQWSVGIGGRWRMSFFVALTGALSDVWMKQLSKAAIAKKTWFRGAILGCL